MSLAVLSRTDEGEEGERMSEYVLPEDKSYRLDTEFVRVNKEVP